MCPAGLYVYIWFVPTNLPISPQQLTSSSHLHSQRRFCLASIVVVSVVMLHCCAAVPRPLLRKPRRRSWFTHYCPLSECSGAIIRARAAGVKQRGNPRVDMMIWEGQADCVRVFHSSTTSLSPRSRNNLSIRSSVPVSSRPQEVRHFPLRPPLLRSLIDILRVWSPVTSAGWHYTSSAV